MPGAVPVLQPEERADERLARALLDDAAHQRLGLPLGSGQERAEGDDRRQHQGPCDAMDP